MPEAFSETSVCRHDAGNLVVVAVEPDEGRPVAGGVRAHEGVLTAPLVLHAAVAERFVIRVRGHTMLVNLRGERFSGRDGFRLVGILDDRDLTLAFFGKFGCITIQPTHRTQIAIHQRKAVQPLRYGRCIGVRINNHIIGIQFIGKPDLPRPDDPSDSIAEGDNSITWNNIIARRKLDGGAVVLHVRNLVDALLPEHTRRHTARQSRRSDLGTVIIGESGTVENSCIAVPHHPGIEAVGTGRMDHIGVSRAVCRKVGGGLHAIFFQGI